MDEALSCREDDEWDLINDDGFVYKRKKRTCSLDPSTPALDQELQLHNNNRRKRKKTTLLKVRGSYQKEILLWEHLSNTLSSMQQYSSSSILHHQLPEPEPPEIHGATATASSGLLSDQFLDRQLIDELLLLVEAQETIIEDAINLCEITEAAIFKKKERQFKLPFTALPVWASSPRALILSLCDDN